MLKIDGTKFEGGGQILRTALALSAVTGIPFEMTDIRKGRDVPGLKKQHVHCIDALREICNASAENASAGAEWIRFVPGRSKGGTVSIDIETAGSITLLLQSLIIPCLFADKDVRLKIKGGTDVKWASSADYFSNVFLPQVSMFAKEIRFNLLSRGYYPEGNGRADVLIKPLCRLEEGAELNSLIDAARKSGKRIELMEQGKILQIKGVSHASRDLMNAEVAERQARGAKVMLSGFGCNIDIRQEYADALSTGSGITLWARFSEQDDEFSEKKYIVLGADALGEKGKKSEDVGKEAALKLKSFIESKAAVDSYLADQLVPFIALFGGSIKCSEITEHVKANAYACSMFLGDVLEIDENNKVIRSKF
jgi:RNA 3'-phosphate cyclase